MSDDTPAALPTEPWHKKGYQKVAVEQFLAEARTAFNERDDSFTPRTVREVSFPVRRGGYQITVVDAALARLEDTLAERAKQVALAEGGADALLDAAREESRVVLAHVRRPALQRFKRVGKLTWGYAPEEVDAVCDRIAAFLLSATPLEADQVRSVAFTMKHGGYNEAQVDALLDATVEILQKVQ